MPSVYSTSRQRPFPSSTVITPSLPTFSKMSARMLPISGSAAEMVAMWAISSRPCTGVAMSLIDSTTVSRALSSPRRTSIGLAPAATFLKPSVMIAWASTVAVVVPSPATSFVLVAASFRSWAPMFSKGSSSSISFAMVTPSLVMVGGPNFLSSTTLRPRGPSVILTASARVSIPFFRERRACSLYMSCLGIHSPPVLVVYHRKDVALGKDQQLVVLELELGASVLRVQHLVALLYFHAEPLAVVENSAGTDRDDLALLGLLLRGVGQHEPALGHFLFGARLHYDAIPKGLECFRHTCVSSIKCPGNLYFARGLFQATGPAATCPRAAHPGRLSTRTARVLTTDYVTELARGVQDAGAIMSRAAAVAVGESSLYSRSIRRLGARR